MTHEEILRKEAEENGFASVQEMAKERCRIKHILRAVGYGPELLGMNYRDLQQSLFTAIDEGRIQ